MKTINVPIDDGLKAQKELTGRTWKENLIRGVELPDACPECGGALKHNGQCASPAKHE